MKYYILNILQIIITKNFKGWGRKRSGRFASYCHKNFGGTLTLLEDGFIRSIGLGIKGAPSFSLVEDTIGIYYDATAPSRLENILNTYDFSVDEALMQTAQEAMALIKNIISPSITMQQIVWMMFLKRMRKRKYSSSHKQQGMRR